MRLLLSMLLGFVAACATPQPQPKAAATAPQRGSFEIPDPLFPAACPIIEPGPLEPGSIRSNGGQYIVRLTPLPGEFPDNETFSLEVWVGLSADPRYCSKELTLSVDAAMPQHGHGMNRVPRVSRIEPGHFLVEGMYFHMTGMWELYLDITDGALTERAQCVVELADE